MKIFRKFKRWAVFCLALVLLLGNVPVTARAADQADELWTAVDAQVKAFAKSLYDADADEDAAWALATYGMTNRKTLNVGHDHPLTATLVNSAIMQENMTEGLTSLIRWLDEPGADEVFLKGNLIWKSEKYSHSLRLITDDVRNGGYFPLLGNDFKGKKNSFDSSLEWMAAIVAVEYYVDRIETTADTVTYSVKVVAWDDFDFSTGNSSVPKELASIIGSFMFRSFHWTSTMTFNLTVPNPCNHRPDNYHFTYDPQERQLYADNTSGYVTNGVERHSFENSGGTQYYYELDRAIQLSSDQPWVMEYAIQRPRYFRMSNAATGYNRQPILSHTARTMFMIYAVEFNEEGKVERTRYYGRIFSDYFNYSHLQLYTFRLENEVYADGSNMIYLSVYNDTKGETAMDRLPLNNYYTSEDGKYILLSENDPYISGMDFPINYIGNNNCPFGADYYDLKVWENGVDAQADDYIVKTVIQPTCTAKGYTEHSCTECGYSYRDSYVSAKGHKFGNWTLSQSAGCESKGSEVRSCKTCGQKETREIVATGHDYQAKVTDATCTEKGYTTYTCACGDSYVGDYTDMLAHSFTTYVSNSDATCTEDGTKTAVCEFCSATNTVADSGSAKGHAYESVVTESTCLEQGYTTHTCFCGDSYIDSFVEATGHEYVKGVCACGDVTTYVEAPTIKISNAASTGKVKVTWERVEGAETYQIYRATSKNGTYKLMKTVTGTTYTNTTATVGKTYYYYVVAVAEDGTTSESSAIKSRTCDLPQPKVTVSNNATNGKVKLNWEKVEGAVGYKVYRSETKDGTYKLMKTVTGTTYTNTSAAAGKTYYYKVKAIAENSAADSAYSEVKSRTCDLPQPEVKISKSSGKPKVNWDKVSGAVSYKVYRSTAKNGTYSLVKTTTSRSYKDTAAKKGTTYYYKVVATCNPTAGNSAYSKVVSMKATK